MENSENILPDVIHTPETQEPTTTYIVVKPWGEAEIEKHAAHCGGRRILQEITIVTDDDYQFAYLVRRPSRNVLRAIGDNKDKPSEVESLMMGLVLEGDKAAFEHDAAIASQLLKQIGGLLKTAKSDIKKL